jgi:hypothetical protein
MYLRIDSTPTQPAPVFDRTSSTAGLFTLPLRGVRKELRRSGPRAERLVKDVENGAMAFMSIARNCGLHTDAR